MIRLKNNNCNVYKSYENKEDLISAISWDKIIDYLENSLDSDKSKKVHDIKENETKGYLELVEDAWTIDDLVDTFYRDYRRI